jgi:uncharacterized DUF497 family protein
MPEEEAARVFAGHSYNCDGLSVVDAVWSAFVTMRGDRIRIISVRRARDEEKAAYLQD